MNKQAHRRHDISDRVWGKIKGYLPGATGKVGRPAMDNRLFINAVLWIGVYFFMRSFRRRIL